MQLQKLLLVFGLALLGISLSEAIPGGRGGGQDDEEKAIEKRDDFGALVRRLDREQAQINEGIRRKFFQTRENQLYALYEK